MKTIRITTLFSFFIVSIIFVACKKEILPKISCSAKSNSVEIVRKLLPGSYSWAYSIVRYLGGSSFIQTPSSTGLNYRYVFTKNGMMHFFENDTLKTTDVYEIDYEFKVSTYTTDSSTIVILNDKETGLRKSFFRIYLCNDSALFYNPYNSIDSKRFFKRN